MVAHAIRYWHALPAALKGLSLLGVALGLALAVWLAGPLFYSTRVEEDFPAPAAADAMAEPAPTADAMAEQKPADAMAETAPAADAMAEQKPADAMAETAPAADAMAETAPTAMPTPTADIVALGSGSFTRVDAVHSGEGAATIYRLGDGRLVLRLEGFRVTNGPDLFVALSGHPSPRSSDEAHADGYYEVARLKASEGEQNYELPADIDLSQFRSVLIYCRAFSVVFSTAELR